MATRFDSRARFRLATDFSCPPEADTIVPWDSVRFQAGADVALQPGGKLLVQAHGLYEFVVSADWALKTGLDYDLRQLGLRLQRAGQPDEPMEAHQRIGFFNTPGSDPPRLARWQGSVAEIDIPHRATVGFEVTVAPAGSVEAGDMAIASHTKHNLQAMPLEALRALIVHAKVVAADTVSVSFHNPSIAEGIHLRAGFVKVLALSASHLRGVSGDAWQVIRSASQELAPGDRVYTTIRHKVPGTVLQTTFSTYLQADRLA